MNASAEEARSSRVRGLSFQPQARFTQWSAENNMVRRVSFYATLVLLFLKFSSIHEIVYVLTGHSLRVMYLVVPAAALGLVMSGGLGRVFQSKLAWIWAGFVFWLVLGIPFSSWVGGSARDLFLFFRTELLMFFLLAGTVVTWSECRKVLYCAAISATIPTLFALRFTSTVAGDRLGFAFSGSIGNPNDLAAHLLLLIPFLLFVLLRPRTLAIVRLAAAGFAVLGVYAVFRTSSRGAVVAIAVASLVYLYNAPVRQKVLAVITLPVVLMLGLLVLPSHVVQRLTSFSRSSEAAGDLSAIQSSEAREYLLRRSIEFSFQYPVFGIGLGQFTSFEGTTSRKEGMRGNWHETHNAYTQIMSETGMPALILFLTLIVVTFRNFSRASARAKLLGNAELALAGNMAIVSFAGFCTAIIFLSLAYTFYIPTLSGLSVALLRLSETPPRRVDGHRLPPIPVSRRVSPARLQPGLQNSATV